MKRNGDYIHWLPWVLFALAIVFTGISILFLEDKLPQKENLSLELDKTNNFIDRTQKVVQTLNDLLLETNKVGDAIQEKYENINYSDEKNAQRINEYYALMEYLGKASAKLRESIALLPKALTAPVDIESLSPVKEKLAEAKFTLNYIQARMSD